MALKRELHKIGHDVFIVGVLIAALLGVLAPVAPTYMIGYAVSALVILGTITGLITIRIKEEIPFLVAALTLVIGAATATFAPIDYVAWPLGTLLTNVLKYVAVFVVPAAAIVALKAVYVLAK